MFRSATQADVDQFYDEPPGYTMRAIVAELDGRVLAVAGTYRAKDHIYAFSEMKDEMRGRKRDILRMAAVTMPLVRRHVQVIAFASKTEKSSQRFLKWLGFIHHGPSENGEVYLWQQ